MIMPADPLGPHKLLRYYQWAWEFLRRNPKYIAAYTDFLETGEKFYESTMFELLEQNEPLRRIFDFGLCYPTAPDTPGDRFFFSRWSPHVRRCSSTLFLEMFPQPAGVNADEVVVTVTIKRGMSMDERIDVFKEEMTRRGLKPDKGGRPKADENFAKYIAAYDIAISNGPKSGRKKYEMGWRDIGLLIEPPPPGCKPLENPLERARGFYDRALDLINGDYRQLLQEYIFEKVPTPIRI